MTKRASSSDADNIVTRSDTDAPASQHYFFPDSGRAIWTANAADATEILNRGREEQAITDKERKDGDVN